MFSTDDIQRFCAHINFANYAHSILILMLWILPINALVLLVWAHNLVVHWLMPFSSHHNVLSIMPFILLVETMTSGAMVPRVTTRYVHCFQQVWALSNMNTDSNTSHQSSSSPSPFTQPSTVYPTPTSSITSRISSPHGWSASICPAVAFLFEDYGAS